MPVIPKTRDAFASRALLFSVSAVFSGLQVARETAIPRSEDQNFPAFAASSTATATATVIPTMGLLPAPISPIIST